MRRSAWGLVAILCTAAAQAGPLPTGEALDAGLTACLHAAYPQARARVSGGVATLEPGHGTRTVPLLQAGRRTFAQQLDRADFLDQLSQPYPSGFGTPAVNHDPGRLRQTALFQALYGATPSRVREALVATAWAPLAGTVMFHGAHGAAQALAQVGQTLALDPRTRALAAEHLGTFNPRVIAGTDRPSAHGFAIAIDLRFPAPLHAYWAWRGCKEAEPCPYPDGVLSDPTLRAVVTAFEQHGFVWGGKWHHYDTMHFEYRPELFAPACRALSPARPR